MNYMDMLQTQLRTDEGVRNKPYVDTKGKVTIGIGRNLTDVGISDDEMYLMFSHDLTRAVQAVVKLFPSFQRLSETRKAVLCNMAFNLGYASLAQFKNLIAAVERRDWAGAAAAMQNSLWAKQVGDRATRLINLMKDST